MWNAERNLPMSVPKLTLSTVRLKRGPSREGCSRSSLPERKAVSLRRRGRPLQTRATTMISPPLVQGVLAKSR